MARKRPNGARWPRISALFGAQALSGAFAPVGTSGGLYGGREPLTEWRRIEMKHQTMDQRLKRALQDGFITLDSPADPAHQRWRRYAWPGTSPS